MESYKEEIPEYEDYVWLEPEGLTQGVSLPDAYLLILRDQDSGRHLPLLLDRSGFQLLVRATKQHEYPMTSLMNRLARTFGIRLRHALIHPAASGRTYVALCMEQTRDGNKETHELNVDPALGIVAAMEARRPVGIARQDFERLYNRHGRSGQATVPITSMGNDLLREALELAAENDNFELASQLRDELRSRDATARDVAPNDEGATD